MMLRIGTMKGFNTDLVQTWEYTPAAAPTPPQVVVDPPDEPPEQPASSRRSRTAGTPPEVQPTPEPTTHAPVLAQLTLYFAGGDQGRAWTLEGEEAEKLRAYLMAKTGAVV